MINKKKHKMHVKKGDTVKVITGRHKGEIGEIIKVISKTNKVIIKNINLKTKHLRATQANETGKIIQIEAPVHSSNVMLYSLKNQIASRSGYVINEKNTKVKILKKTGEII